MNEDISGFSSTLNLLIEKFDMETRIARAAELALSNRLLQAEALLAPNGTLPRTWQEMDMLARIHVKQGRLSDALRRWHDASKLSNLERFKSELLALSDYGEVTYVRQKRILWAAFGAWMVLLVLLVIFFYMYLRR